MYASVAPPPSHPASLSLVQKIAWSRVRHCSSACLTVARSDLYITGFDYSEFVTEYIPDVLATVHWYLSVVYTRTDNLSGETQFETTCVCDCVCAISCRR